MCADLSETVAAEVETRVVIDSYTGPAKVAGFTVLHERGQTPRGLLLVDTPDRHRALVTTTEPSSLEAMGREEFVGRQIGVVNDELTT